MSLGSIGSMLYSVGTTGVLGAVVAKTGEGISQKIGSLNPLKIVSRIVPQCVKNSLTTGILNKAMEFCNIEMALRFHSFKMSSTIGTPILEEAVFRAGIQQILTLALSYGMDPEAAQLTSIALTSAIFAMAHGKELDSVPGTDLWLKSVGFGASYSQGGYLAAVAAHMINNIRQHYLPSISELWQKDSEEDAFFEMLKVKTPSQ